MPLDLLDAIRANLAREGVVMANYVARVKKRCQKRVAQSRGFLRDLSNRVLSKTCSAGPPVTAAEAEARDYQYPMCGSRVRGEGALLAEGRAVPCSCASPEWISRQRVRGVFADEQSQ